MWTNGIGTLADLLYSRLAYLNTVKPTNHLIFLFIGVLVSFHLVPDSPLVENDRRDRP